MSSVGTVVVRWLGIGLAACILAGAAFAQPQPSPHAIDIPPWFVDTFLDFREDVDEAARAGKRLLVYFGQDGCPYCKKLMTANFSQPNIVAKTRAGFLPVALNLWGDRELKWLDGRTLSEKELGRVLGVQFTPTILIFDERGKVVVRLDGYYPPQRFNAVLDYAAGRMEDRLSLAHYLRRNVKEKASPTLNQQAFLLPAPHDLTRTGTRPLAVIFETVDCSPCDELHREAFRRADVLAQVRHLDVARFALGASVTLKGPDGRERTAETWARELGIVYAPSIVFFDATGREVFRTAAYLRPFHVASSFAYVAEQAYRSEPSFQRYLQARADAMRARGERVDLWE
jgi:thioredoxin-related protein